MPHFIKTYVRVVDRMNYVLGRLTMLTIFVMVGVMFYSAVMKTFFNPSLWTYEFAQFLMVGYFMVGGPYSMQLKGHVRMDLLYGNWQPRNQARWDVFTSFFLIAYLGLLLYGAIDSTIYAISFGERSYSIWRPYMWPVKLVMVFGILLMLLQALSEFFKDLATIQGKSLS
ncbi:MAG: TRAP transporter small permease subunit [bacterium]|jgi:TRAP-type mannitol/chloroaromatic compound transport system permease small subunit